MTRLQELRAELLGFLSHKEQLQKDLMSLEIDIADIRQEIDELEYEQSRILQS